MSRRHREFAAFAVVGTLGFVADVGLLYGLDRLAPALGWHAARVLSFLGAATLTWALNRRFTFATPVARGVPPGREYLRYLASMLLGGAVNYAVYASTLRWLDGGWVPALGVALGSVAGLAVNFLAARHLVFKSR